MNQTKYSRVLNSSHVLSLPRLTLTQLGTKPASTHFDTRKDCPHQPRIRTHTTHPEKTMNTEQNREETPVNLGDLINLFYQEYLALYGDEELASVAAAATINEMLSESINDTSDAAEKEEVEAA